MYLLDIQLGGLLFKNQPMLVVEINAQYLGTWSILFGRDIIERGRLKLDPGIGIEFARYR